MMTITAQRQSTINWRLRVLGDAWHDGDTILAAVPVRVDGKPITWEVSVVRFECGEGYSEVLNQDGDQWGWDTEDIKWWAYISDVIAGLPDANGEEFPR